MFRYSLNEEKLLRATFDFREQLVLLSCESGVPQSGMPPGYNTSIGEVPVRVLDCDTITQVRILLLVSLVVSRPLWFSK